MGTEAGRRITFNTSIHHGLLRAVKHLSADESVNMNVLIEEAIRDLLIKRHREDLIPSDNVQERLF
jgi:hypothetical protein